MYVVVWIKCVPTAQKVEVHIVWTMATSEAAGFVYVPLVCNRADNI